MSDVERFWSGRLTRKGIAAAESLAARGEFDRALFDRARDVGLTFGLAGYAGEADETVRLPLLAERDGLRLVGGPGHKLLIGPEYPHAPGAYWRAWLVEYDGPPVPAITMPGVTGAAALAE